MDVFEYEGEGYRRLVNGPVWTVAMLNYADRFDERNLTRVERHLNTDEAFVLLAGEATLVLGRECRRVALEPCRVYNVKAGEWHHIIVKPDTHVLIAENSDTGLANTEYLDVIGIPDSDEPKRTDKIGML